MTYYKYAERDATSQVNWADVSKKFSDEIIRVGKEREKKRDTIDTATDELVTKINEAPMGQHANANSFTASLVDQTTEDTLRMNKLLKSGDIKPSEYMNYIENQKASVTGLYDMVTGYQSVYADKMKRMQDGDSLPFEWEGMAAVEGFGNFANTTPVIDMYGNVTMVNDATGETMSVAEQRAITKQYFNAYDIDGAMEKQKDQLGQYLTVEMTGNTKTIDDVRRQDGFIKYMDDLVAETLAGPLATSTILLKDLPGYSTSFSPGDDPNKVLTSILDPRQPGSGAQIPLVEVVEQVEKMSDTERRKIFSENADVEALIRVAKAQREDAKQWAKKDLNFRLNRIETARQEFPDSTGATRTTAGERGLLRQGEAGLRSLEKLHGGNEKEANEGLQNLLDRNYSKFSEGTVTIDEETGERTAVLVRYNPDTKQKEEVAIPIPASVMNTIDAFGPQFFGESTRPYLYEAYDVTERLYGGKPGTATPSVSRPRAVSAENLDAEPVEFAGKEMDFATALSALKNEATTIVGVTEGLRLANANASTLLSIAGQLNLNAEIGVLPEDDMEEKLGFDPRHTAVTMKFPDVNGFEVVILNDTEGVNAQRQLFREMAKRKINGESMTVDEILKYLPSNSRELNKGENHNKIAAGSKMRLAEWKTANASEIAGKTAAEINRMYAEYYKQ